MKKFSWLDFAALVVWILPAVYLFSIYSSLPQIVPVHYGFHGNVDKYGTKQEFLIAPCILMGISGLVYLLLKFLPSIDPKKQVKYGEATFQKIAVGVVVFFAALNISILYATTHHNFQLDRLLFPIFGLLFVFFGNMFNNIKPNYFAGIRTPWTLENEDNWRATHRLAGKIWFVGGIILTVGTLFLPPADSTFFLIGCVAIMTLVPIVYSYVYFKKHQLN